MKIAAVVLNSVLHDARVAREAESLAQAGHDVRIFGIQDNKIPFREFTTPKGVPVLLAPWRQQYYQLSLKMHAWYLPVMAAAVLLLGLVPALLVWLVPLAWQAGPALFFGVPLFLLAGAYFLQNWLLQGIRLRRLAQVYGKDAAPAKEVKPIGRSLIWIARSIVPSMLHPWKIKGEAELFLDRAVRAWAMRETIFTDLMAFRPDVVHCHDVGTLPLGLACKKEFQSKVIYDSHELHAELTAISLMAKLVTIWRERQAAPRLDACITVNPFIAQELAARYRKLPEPLVICNATRVLKNASVYDGRLHEAAGLEHKQRILLYQGGFSINRGLRQLLRSAAKLPDAWSVVFMGWGSLEERLRLDAQALGLEDGKVVFLPPAAQEELPFWTAGATLGIIPYENAGLNHWLCSPNKLWEYPQAGVPFLASPFPFMRSIVQRHGVGWLLDPMLEPVSIAAQVAGIADEDFERARMNCAEFIRKDNWQLYADRLLHLYAGFEKR